MLYSNIAELAKQNSNFRKVLFTSAHSQVVLMSLLPEEEIGMETHPDNDQILYFVAGSGKAIVNGEEHMFGAGDIVEVPAGAEHNFINTGSEDIKLFTVYAPAHHPDGTVHATKEDAMAAEEAEHH